LEASLLSNRKTQTEFLYVIVVPDYTVWRRDYPPIRELYEC